VASFGGNEQQAYDYWLRTFAHAQGGAGLRFKSSLPNAVLRSRGGFGRHLRLLPTSSRSLMSRLALSPCNTVSTAPMCRRILLLSIHETGQEVEARQLEAELMNDRTPVPPSGRSPADWKRSSRRVHHNRERELSIIGGRLAKNCGAGKSSSNNSDVNPRRLKPWQRWMHRRQHLCKSVRSERISPQE